MLCGGLGGFHAVSPAVGGSGSCARCGKPSLWGGCCSGLAGPQGPAVLEASVVHQGILLALKREELPVPVTLLSDAAAPLLELF